MKWKSRRFKSERQTRKKQTSYFSKDAVLRNIIKNSTAEPDWSRLSDRIGDIEVFELKEVPLASLSLDSEPRDSKRFDYAEMDTEPPPITIDETGAVIDGRHRVYAARDMGKSTIKAYVPTHLTPQQASRSTPNVQSEFRDLYSAPAAVKISTLFPQSSATRYWKLTQEQKRILMRELNDEGTFEGDRDNRARQAYESRPYSFVSIPPSILPMSAWEDPNEENADGKHTSRIATLEQSIKENGFDSTRPLLVAVHSGRALVQYGNHRLQAVRNLIAEGHLPSDFEIPSIIMYY